MWCYIMTGYNVSVKGLTVETRIQLRGICPFCFKQQAVSASGVLAAHGYTLDYHFQNGACFGSGNVHYGHEQAPALIQRVIDNYERHIKEAPATVAKMSEKLAACQDIKEAKALRRSLAMEQEWIASLPAQIEALQSRLTNWQLVEPVAVDLVVEERKAKAAAAAVRESRKLAKEQAEIAKAERAAKREANAKLREETFKAINYYRLMIDGQLRIETAMPADSEDAAIQRAIYFVKDELKASGVSREDVGFMSIGNKNAYCEIRTAPHGKGRCLFSTLKF